MRNNQGGLRGVVYSYTVQSMKRFRFRAKRKEAFSFLGRASLDWSETREESWLSPVVVLDTRGVHTESRASPRRDERTTRRRGTTPNILPSAADGLPFPDA